jgi:hypothetical protein
MFTKKKRNTYKVLVPSANFWSSIHFDVFHENYVPLDSHVYDFVRLQSTCTAKIIGHQSINSLTTKLQLPSENDRT